MKSILSLLIFVVACNAAIAQAGGTAAAFSSGNIVVYRVGNGSRALSNTTTLVFFDEYTPAGTLVQSVAVPRKLGTTPGITASGTATTEGMINRTADGKYILFTGYNADTAVSAPATSSALSVPRAAGRIDAGGSIAVSAFDTGTFSGVSIRSAASVNGTDIYLAGSGGGIRKATLGNAVTIRTSATGSNPSGVAYPSNFRTVGISGGQLYASTGSGTTFRMTMVGTGLPADTGAAVVNLPGTPSSGSPYQFFFADLSASVAGNDVLYITDDQVSGGVSKYSLVSGTWVANGKATPSAAGTRGLTAIVSGTTVKLFITTNNTILATLTDTTGYNKTISPGAFTTIATAPANTAFRGLALAPEASNPSFVTDYFRSAATGNWSSTATWESSADSVSWHAATLTPGANAAAIIIRDTHIVTVTANVTARKPTINTGGRLNVNSGVVLTTE